MVTIQFLMKNTQFFQYKYLNSRGAVDLTAPLWIIFHSL